jgi:hypothetical protein
MARCAKIKELDLAMLGTQTASIFTLRFAENAESNVPKWIRSEAQTLHTVFVTERFFENYSKSYLLFIICWPEENKTNNN